MASMITIPPKTSGETTRVTFDFLSQLPDTDTVASATATATVWSGTDASPSAVVSGSPTVSGTKAYVILTGGVAGNVYMVTVTATPTTNTTLRPVIQTFLAVVDTPI